MTTQQILQCPVRPRGHQAAAQFPDPDPRDLGQDPCILELLQGPVQPVGGLSDLLHEQNATIGLELPRRATSGRKQAEVPPHHRPLGLARHQHATCHGWRPCTADQAAQHLPGSVIGVVRQGVEHWPMYGLEAGLLEERDVKRSAIRKPNDRTRQHTSEIHTPQQTGQAIATPRHPGSIQPGIRERPGQVGQSLLVGSREHPPTGTQVRSTNHLVAPGLDQADSSFQPLVRVDARGSKDPDTGPWLQGGWRLGHGGG